MVVGENHVQHQRFDDFPELLQSEDLLILNDSKVIKARLRGHKDTGGKVELLVERIESVDTALCNVRSSKPLQPGRTVICNDHILHVVERLDPFYRIRFEQSVERFLENHGSVPIPPYLGREEAEFDKDSYQTVYAKNSGSVAAPTAGLHFSEQLLEKVQANGVDIKYVTLHIGLGTFEPVRTSDIASHQMHSERYEIPFDTVKALQNTKGRVVAVGTTVVRTLESWAKSGKTSGETDLFITPGFKFNVIDALITNFHLPESSLLMLVSAFAGHDRVMNAYRDAVANEYRFFSYGDAMFLEREENQENV